MFLQYISKMQPWRASLKTIKNCIVLNICTVRLKKTIIIISYITCIINNYILIIIIILLRNLCIFTSSIYGCQFAIKVPQGVRSSDTVVFSVVFAILQRSYPRFNLN